MTFRTHAPLGLPPIPYRIRSIGNEVGEGATAPYYCTIGGVLKFDSTEHAPNCVYNELVAMRLGTCLGAPVASGALVAAERGEGFVSLRLGARNFQLPNIHEQQWAEAVRAFPNHAASLVAFDILIGNFDRKNNMKADLKRKGFNLFAGFDHSHCLLDITLDRSPEKSLEILESDALIVEEHPFYKTRDLYTFRLAEYVERIGEIPDSVIDSCCVLGDDFRKVTRDHQERLAGALNKRKRLLKQIVSTNSKIIFA